MRRFLKHIGIVLLVVISLMVVLDKAYTYVFKHSEPRSKVQKILQLSNEHYDYIFLGSSRTENHIDCEVITKITGKSCINFGISGGSIGDMLVLMRLMETNKVTFNKVFLQLDYNYNSTGLSQNFKARLMPFIDEPAVKNELNIVGMDNAQMYVPFYRFLKNDQVIGFREVVSSMINKKPKTDLNVGFAPKIGVGDKVSTSFPKIINPSNDEVAAIEGIVKDQERKIQFFTAPYCPEVKAREKAINELNKRVAHLWDYSAIYDDKPAYFYNCGHLNIEGARDFSRIIATRDLLKEN